jgi:uncharacterized membrane protein YeaQ/YmgE (transglycosylase-associated protein family)
MIMSHIIWIIVIGFVAGLLARWFSPAPNNPSGFILTTLLGIAGAFLATFIGQAIGWYRLDQDASFIGATLGAIVLLLIWRAFAGKAGTVGPDTSGPRNRL